MPKRIQSGDSDPRTAVIVAALFTTAKTGGQRECPLTDEWINRMLSGRKRKEGLVPATAGTGCEAVRHREQSQTQKDGAE